MTYANERSLEGVTVGETDREVAASGLSRRGMLTALGAGALATGAMALGVPTAATASPARFDPHIPVVEIDVTTAGSFSLPAHVPAGFVTFKITSRDADAHAVQGFRLKPGASVQAVIDDFSVGLLGTYPERAAAATKLLGDATLIGGAATTPFVPITVTVALEPGTYYFVDFSDLGNITPRVHSIEAVGRFHWRALPHVDAVILTREEDGEPRFITPTSLKAKGNYLFYNNGDEFHEVVFRPTVAGTTDEYITAFYDAVLAGGPRPASPWTGVQHGLQAISPGRWAIFGIDLPAGPYSEICYVPDDMLGIPHAYEGMHVQVTLS